MTDTPAPKAEKKPNVYKDTVFLPKTAFPMKAGLPKSEPEWLKRWNETGLYARQRASAKGRPKFIHHDGPPYANGNIHLGTAFNKILKDFVARSRGMMGFDAPYVHGWDCHGLPIEWKVEEQYRAKGKNKDDIPVSEFRAECRAFANHWLNVQRSEFRRLGGTGEWDNPYTTMDFRAEARIVNELLTFARHGLLYRGSKPVMWSPVERTALAEAEIEYHDKNSPQIWVLFPVLKGAEALKAARVMIWTTTPWTIPANRAVSFSREIAYGVYESESMGRIVVADTLAEGIAKAGNTALTRVADAPDMSGVVLGHPLRGHGYDFEVPMLAGSHVTADTGTGFVHTAPGHGADDYHVWMASGLSSKDIPDTVGPEGEFLAHVPLFAGLKILKDDGKDGPANVAVIEKLKEVGALFASARFQHSYPHSWRSRAPIIFRNTPQWFAPMDKAFTVKGEAGPGLTLRQRALEAIEETAFYPAQGRNRLKAMIETRPDWVLSRQRAWGVPLALFVNKASGEILLDEAVNGRIIAAVEKDGADAWYVRDPQSFLGDGHKAADFEQVKDILDVWFDSGSTHAFVLDDPIEKDWALSWPADLYLEGSDQHRGWFQSSLLQACGTRGRAPYKAIATHGFIVDGKGIKMSKSLGNTISPVDVSNEQGADILRLWAATADYGMDPPLDKTILTGTAETYRKLRNTLRYLLGALDGYSDAEAVAPAEMPELERYMLHLLDEARAEVQAGFEAYDFIRVSKAVTVLATNDMSAFYFDIRKDALYCDAPDSLRRRASRTVMDMMFHALVTWLAPFMPFTTEEAWQTRFPSADDSVHLRLFWNAPEGSRNDALAAKWETIRTIRRAVTGALEIQRRDKVIGASLEAAPAVYLSERSHVDALAGEDLADIAIISGVTVKEGKAPDGAFMLDDAPGISVVFAKADGAKCVRCWKVLPEVGSHADHPELCTRCAGAVRKLPDFRAA